MIMACVPRWSAYDVDAIVQAKSPYTGLGSRYAGNDLLKTDHSLRNTGLPAQGARGRVPDSHFRVVLYRNHLPRHLDLALRRPQHGGQDQSTRTYSESFQIIQSAASMALEYFQAYQTWVKSPYCHHRKVWVVSWTT